MQRKIMRLDHFIGAIFGLTLAVATIHAAVVPGRWDKVESQPLGEPITIRLKAGDLIEGAFRGSGDSLVKIATPAGDDLEIPKSSISEVSLQIDARDSALNGTLLGMAAGLAFGGVLVAIDGSARITSDPGGSGGTVRVQSGDNDLPEAPVIAGFGAVGALIGFAVDRQSRPSARYEVIYRHGP